MKCRICGAKLRKDGDICKSCYEEYCKEEELEKDVNEIYKIHRKYLPSYQLTRYIDWYFVSIFVLFAFIGYKQYLSAVLFLIFALVLLGIVMFLEKRKAINTTCVFYEKKVVLKYKDREKTIAYSDLKDVTYYQNFFQKIYHLADIQFHPQSGTYLIGGFELKNVPNIEESWEEILEIINIKKEK